MKYATRTRILREAEGDLSRALDIAVHEMLVACCFVSSGLIRSAPVCVPLPPKVPSPQIEDPKPGGEQDSPLG